MGIQTIFTCDRCHLVVEEPITITAQFELDRSEDADERDRKYVLLCDAHGREAWETIAAALAPIEERT